MANEVSNLVKIIMNEANEEAKLFNDIMLKPEHILLRIVAKPNINSGDEIYSVLNKLKVNFDLLTEQLIKDLVSTDLTPRLDRIPNVLPFSEDAQKIIRSLDEQCKVLNDSVINISHLLLSILHSRCKASSTLSLFGITYNVIKQELIKMKNQFNDEFSEEYDDDRPSRRAKRKSDTKTPVLDNFCRDVSKMVERGETDPVVGREKEIKRVSQILSRRKKNNPVLIGVPGSGKTSIVDGLAQMILDGNAPRTLSNKKIYSLDLASIVAGTKYRGQFEERMKAILEECKNNKDVILFIDELHTIIGAGNSSGALDASNIFKPALARGEIQIIGATTLDEYREHIEKDGALTRRFQQVLVDEPTIEETKIILTNIKEKYEKHHKVKYTDEAIDECVKLAHRYIMERAMPDKAIDVLDEAGAATNVVIEKPQEIKDLEQKRVNLLLRKKDVVAKQQFEQAAQLRDEEKKIDSQLSKALEDWNEKLKDNVTIVGVEQISDVVSTMTGIPVTKISSQEGKRLMQLDKELSGKVIGQDNAVTKVVRAIKRSRIGIKDKGKPLGTFIFLGPTGVGKTMLAKLLAEHVFGDDEALIRIDMSEYAEKFNVSRLIGSPPGYIGHEEGGQLTEKVRRKPYSVVLLDEIEKAHEDIFNILLQVLDEGHLTDGLGRKVNFKNTLIIMTSNIGVAELNMYGHGIGYQTSASIVNEEAKTKAIIEKALKKKFKPEFLNRLDEPIIFNALSREDIHKIIYLEIKKLQNRISELGFKLDISDEAIEFLGNEGYDAAYGARPLNRAIQRYIEDPLSDEILSGNIKDNDTVKIVYNKETKSLEFIPVK